MEEQSIKTAPGFMWEATPFCAQHHFLDLRRVGQHGDDHITLLSDLLLGGALCTGGLQLLHRSLAAVVHQQVGVAAFSRFFAMGLPMMPRPIKPIFIIVSSIRLFE